MSISRLAARELFGDRRQLETLLASFSQAKVAVIGDFFLDRYLVIDPALDEPSVETGLSARQVVAIRNSPGAAGTVVNNLVALGAGEIHAVGVIGEDAYGFELRRELQRRRVSVEGLIHAADRFTPTYTKPVELRGADEVELERLDIINRTPTPAALQEQTLEAARSIASRVDAVVVLDQVAGAELGVITRRVREGLAKIATQNPRTIFFADSRAFIGQFTSMMIKPNHHEALRAIGRDDSATDDDLLEAARALHRGAGRPVFLTCGSRGILLADDNGQSLVPGFPVDGPIDVTGAGDSATAGAVLSLCGGASPAQAALVANLVASITIQQLRTTGTATREQTLARFETNAS